MLHDTVATDYERGVIAGHYIFSTDEFADIKKEILSISKTMGADLDNILKNAVKSGIYRCINNFGLIKRKPFIQQSELQLVECV